MEKALRINKTNKSRNFQLQAKYHYICNPGSRSKRLVRDRPEPLTKLLPRYLNPGHCICQPKLLTIIYCHNQLEISCSWKQLRETAIDTNKLFKS